ncbi:MAG: Lrp/AsnC family transcriptional regulator [Dehalococcoidales bacterium]|nr:Lrp/AsnC family transcriptional regulator [Dehalococcoidales bacterium]
MLKKILKILEDDARATPERIATMLGTSEDEVTAIIKKAEAEGKILKYKTLINWDKVNDEHVWALIEVQVSPQRDTGYDAIAEKIYRFPQARSVYLMSGTYDLAVLVMGKSMHEIADFVGQKLSPIEGVRAASTHFIMRRYKEDGEIMNGKEEIKRQPVIL